MDKSVQNILDLCAERGVAITRVLTDLGFSRGLGSQWKAGKQKPSADKLQQIADYFGVSVDDLIGRENSAELLPQRGLRFVPVFETVAAGFGAYADSCPVGVVADYIESDYDAENTIAIKVRGDSMYPKIEDGDLVIVRRDVDWYDGSIVVALIDGDEGVVKRIFQTATRLTLESINPAYPPRRFEREEMNRVQVVGVVQMVIKEV